MSATRTSAPLRIGIIGAGNVALHGHVPGWMARADFTLAAGADPRPGSRAALSALVPGLQTYSTLPEMLAAVSLDCVDVCTPPAAHFEVIRGALSSGLHVICEKPLVLRTGEMEEIRRRAEEAGRVVFPVHNWKHAPALARAGELVRSGAVGRVRRCLWEVFRSQPAGTAAENAGEAGNWRVDPEIAGGGVLTDHGWHAFYVLSGWLGFGVRRIQARLDSLKYRELAVEDTARVTLDFGEATAEIFLTWAADRRGNRVQIEGTEGQIRISEHTVEWAPVGGARRRWELAESLSEGSHHPEWFGNVIEAFVSEMADSGIRGRGLTEAARCLRLLTLARESDARGGAWVEANVPETGARLTRRGA
jgi:predicted dehydrogenase